MWYFYTKMSGVALLVFVYPSDATAEADYLHVGIEVIPRDPISLCWNRGDLRTFNFG